MAGLKPSCVIETGSYLLCSPRIPFGYGLVGCVASCMCNGSVGGGGEGSVVSVGGEDGGAFCYCCGVQMLGKLG